MVKSTLKPAPVEPAPASRPSSSDEEEALYNGCGFLVTAMTHQGTVTIVVKVKACTVT